MSSFVAVYLREMLILRRRLIRQVLGMSISPLLYMLTFGWALGSTIAVGGRSYLQFLIPGLAAMASMTQAFAIAGEINVARFYLHVFEEFQAAPVSRLSFVWGEVLAGLTRALLAIVIVLGLGWLFGVSLVYGIWFWLAIVLNSLAFASLAVALAMVVKSHADQALLTNFVITPMAFLGGTFFPLESLPGWAKGLLYVLPLSHASTAARAGAFGQSPGWSHYLVLGAVAAVFFILAILTVGKARD
ncbi:MAG: ABC transporter permease [Deltaproteobacteria bacterium]|jgi:ABC-type multidrug transport system permease subunit|nr:ABC transporter permease [Deltaproteobacteria bacterium]